MISSTRAAFTRLAGAAFVAAAAARPVRAQSLTPLVLALIPGDIAAEGWYAQDTGIFKKHGLDATFVPIANGAAISAAVLGGSADIGYSNVISLATAHTRGLPIALLQAANMHVAAAPTAGIVAVKKTSPYQKAKDLDGKTFAITGINNIAHISTRSWLDKNGADSTTAKFLELPLSEMGAALEASRIDAAIMDAVGDLTFGKPGDPLRRLGSAFDAVSTRFAPSVWFSTSDWIAKHPAAAKAVVEALHETALWANGHRHESAAILAKYTHQPVEGIEGIVRVTYGERLTADLIQPNVDAAAKYGVLKAFPIGEMIASIAAG